VQAVEDGLSNRYQDLLTGSYDCGDRLVLNGSYRMGHDPAGFRLWWRPWTGSDQTLDHHHLMRLAGRFGRRVRPYAKAHQIPVIDGGAGERKHHIAEEYLQTTQVKRGWFLILVGRAQARVGDGGRNDHLSPNKPMPYLNHSFFPSVDPDGGPITIQLSGHPPFPAQVMVNGPESVADQGAKAGIHFTQEGNCFTPISDAAGLAKIADTWCEESAIGRLRQACERWIYSTCLCFG
jgi:hypothetical protein